MGNWNRPTDADFAGPIRLRPERSQQQLRWNAANDDGDGRLALKPREGIEARSRVSRLVFFNPGFVGNRSAGADTQKLREELNNVLIKPDLLSENLGPQ